MKVWLADIGTFTLVFAGVGATAAGVETLGVAFAFGSAVAVMVAAVGPISPAHFNPAVTVVFFALRRIRLVDIFLCWSAACRCNVRPARAESWLRSAPRERLFRNYEAGA